MAGNAEAALGVMRSFMNIYLLNQIPHTHTHRHIHIHKDHLSHIILHGLFKTFTSILHLKKKKKKA